LPVGQEHAAKPRLVVCRGPCLFDCDREPRWGASNEADLSQAGSVDLRVGKRPLAAYAESVQMVRAGRLRGRRSAHHRYILEGGLPAPPSLLLPALASASSRRLPYVTRRGVRYGRFCRSIISF